MLKGLKEFILRGNVIDLAVGVVVGAAFNGAINALVKDLITPFIAALVKAPDFSNLMFTINDSKFMYGDFLNQLISFLIVATTIYFLIVAPRNAITARTKKEEVMKPTVKKCPECLSEIPVEATRCAHCTTKLA